MIDKLNMIYLMAQNETRSALNDETGAAMPEYAWILIAIAVVAAVAFSGLGERIVSSIDKVLPGG